MVNETLSPAQFAQILQTDPNEVVRFIVNNNFDAVADNLQGIGFNRPTSPRLAGQQLNALLAAKQDNDFVAALSVPINGQQLTPELMATLIDIGLKGSGSTGFIKSGQPLAATDVARGLAIGALAMLNSAAQQTATGSATEGGGTTTTTTQAPAPTDAEQRRKVWRMVGWGILITIAIVGLAYGVRALAKR